MKSRLVWYGLVRLVDEAKSVYVPALFINEMKIKQDQSQLNRLSAPTKQHFHLYPEEEIEKE